MKYSIIRTDKANDLLYNIINYIAEDSGDIDIAIGYLDKIGKAVMEPRSFLIMVQNQDIAF